MIAFIGVGSNVGDRQKNIEMARRFLIDSELATIEKTSTICETDPFGYTDQPNFLNCVWQIETDLPPHDLLKFLKSIEKKVGRRERFRWGPREIDLDILIYGEIKISTPDLTIPHRGLHERPFVLQPLAEIAPDFTHPILDLPIRDLFQRLANDQ